MPCYFPLTAYYSKTVGESGKRGITFSRGASHTGIPLQLPCGRCVGCRLERSRQWAMRCVHEKSMWSDNEFVTLIYDDAHLPPMSSLSKRDMQLFMKRLRKEKGDGIRFYGCGEYGSRTFRPHYHIVLFNCGFRDRKYFKLSESGQRLYASAELSDLWGKGHVLTGDVTFESCAYVARYITKKVLGDDAKSYYEAVTPDGEVVSMQPEFTLMSRRPGIGARWFEKFGSHAYEFDSVIMNGKEVRPPRFYDTRMEVLDAARISELKVKRRRVAMTKRADNTPQRRRVRAYVAMLSLRAKQDKQEM